MKTMVISLAVSIYMLQIYVANELYPKSNKRSHDSCFHHWNWPTRSIPQVLGWVLISSHKQWLIYCHCFFFNNLLAISVKKSFKQAYMSVSTSKWRSQKRKPLPLINADCHSHLNSFSYFTILFKHLLSRIESSLAVSISRGCRFRAQIFFRLDTNCPTRRANSFKHLHFVASNYFKSWPSISVSKILLASRTWSVDGTLFILRDQTASDDGLHSRLFQEVVFSW